jgi:hypothetical protein
MQEIMERRFRWNLRQVVATAAETERAVTAASADSDGAEPERAAFIADRVAALREFFSAVDAGVGAFSRGEALAAEPLQAVFARIPIEGAGT